MQMLKKSGAVKRPFSKKTVLVAGVAACLAAAAHFSMLWYTSPKQKTLWCNYSPLSDTLEVSYLQKASEIEHTGPFVIEYCSRKFSGAKPLAVACENETIWWIDPKTVYRGEIKRERGFFGTIGKVRAFSHINVAEYKGSRAGRVINADIWLPSIREGILPRTSATPSLATIAHNGVFRVLKPPVDMQGVPESSISLLDDRHVFNEEELWPGETETAHVRMLTRREISVIPVDVNMAGSTVHIYHIKLPSDSYSGEGVKVKISPMDIRKADRQLKTIIDVDNIRYDKQEGGWIAQIIGLMENKKQTDFAVLLRPSNVTQQPKTVWQRIKAFFIGLHHQN